ncbi:MAG: zinc ribbon domain-containing protein [Cytophagales bacterium]|nr:zinc ribbon domain-containing protein [Armatimonadota bacterium]
MPIFEFRCSHCGRKFSALVGVVAGANAPVCPKCGASEGLTKLVSRFARLRSEDEALDSLAEQADTLDEEDPRAMRRLMKEMAGEMGDDLDADEFEALMTEADDDAGGVGGSSDDGF